MSRFNKVNKWTGYPNKFEIMIEKSTKILIIISLIDIISILFFPCRYYHFKNFPNFHLIGFFILLVFSILRINQAYREGGGTLNFESKAEREWKDRKGIGYDYEYPILDFSNLLFNIIYLIGVVIGIALVLIEFLKNIKAS